jgi:hypothetical protein
MNLKTEFFLAKRYLRPKRSAVSIITCISVIGVLLGVAVLIVVLSVMTGFTDLMRKKLLAGGAHVQIDNPYYKSASPMKLYLESRVKLQEKNKRFIEWIKNSKTKRANLSKARKQVVENKKEQLMLFIEEIEVIIPKYKKRKLTAMAIAHYNDLWKSRGDYEKFANEDSDISFLKRITKNMLRHEFSDYEDRLCEIFGQIGVSEGYIILKKKVNNEINKVYPFLK